MSATCKARAALSFSSSFISLEEVELLESHDSLLFVGLWTFLFLFFLSFSVVSCLYLLLLFCLPPVQLGDATFQVYKDGDYGNYLDVEATLNEQSEELEGFLEK